MVYVSPLHDPSFMPNIIYTWQCIESTCRDGKPDKVLHCNTFTDYHPYIFGHVSILQHITFPYMPHQPYFSALHNTQCSLKYPSLTIISLSITASYSLVPRPLPPRKKGPGIYCLCMREIIARMYGKGSVNVSVNGLSHMARS